jgi:predicted ester cyclase
MPRPRVHFLARRPLKRSGPLHGQQAARGFYDTLFADLSGEKVTTLRRYYGPDFVVDESPWEGTAPGTPFGIPGGGRRLSFRLLHIFDMAHDGKIKREKARLRVDHAAAHRAAVGLSGAPALASPEVRMAPLHRLALAASWLVGLAGASPAAADAAVYSPTWAAPDPTHTPRAACREQQLLADSSSLRSRLEGQLQLGLQSSTFPLLLRLCYRRPHGQRNLLRHCLRTATASRRRARGTRVHA